MASALTAFLLGCWLAGQSRVSGQRKFPKPSLSVSPRGVTEPGENVTFRCGHGQPGMRFVLYRSGHPVNTRDPSGNVAEFPIPSVGPGNRGSYTCRYYTISQTPDWSEPSDPVEFVVAELSYAKPTISLRPRGRVALGGAVTVRCRGWHQNVRFLLYKDGNRNVLQDAEPAGDVAEFPISNVSPIHGGSYRCCYHSKSDPPVWSHPSDPVELVLADYTQGNIVRLALCTGVLLALALILAEAAPGWRRGNGVTVTPSEVMPHHQDGAGRTSAAEPV